MEINLKLNKSSKQHQTSRKSKSKDQIFLGDQSSNYQDRLKANNLVGPSNCDLKYELRPDAQNEDSVQPYLNGNKDNDDEMVKYMSNLPEYLQHQDGVSVNFQGNALNVGVLDWSRLESWKDEKKSSMDTVGKAASFIGSKSTVNSFSSGTYNKPSCHKNKLRSSASIDSSLDMGGSTQSVKPSTTQSSTHIQDCETAPKRKVNRQKNMTWTSKSFDRYFVDGMIRTDKNKDQESSSKQGNSISSLRDIGLLHCQGENMRSLELKVDTKVQELQESSSRRKRSEKKYKKSGPSSSVFVDQEGSTSSKNKTNAGRAQYNSRWKELQDSKANPGDRNCAIEPKNIVLLYSKNLRRSSFSDVPQHPDPGTTAKGLRGSEKLTRQRKDHDTIGYIPKELQSAKICNDMPKSSRLPTKSEDDTKQKVISSLKTQKKENLSSVSDKFAHSSKKPEMLPELKSVEKCQINLETTNLYSVANKPGEKYGVPMKAASSILDETLKILDQETAELTVNRSSHSSLNRRFSFSMPRFSQSFSFKEVSEVPQLSSSYVSVKSNPVSSDAFAHLHATKSKKENGHSRAKSSPFRRLIDPLLRSKGTFPFRSPLGGQPVEGNFDLNVARARSHGKEDIDSEIKAILKLTVKNGLPVYKFLVDNDSNIFAATMKNFSVAGKDDSGQSYTFYSINEIKKKNGSWLAQGSKGKSARYAYNVVGQMKISSYSTSDMAARETGKDYMVTESVLLNVDPRQAGKECSELFPDKELAAVIVKIPRDILSHGPQLTVEDKDSVTKRYTDECLLNHGRTEVSSNTTVILPGGVHSLPLSGEPSSLISRWKSGGSCDCGGWDVGCRLRVLVNEKECCKDQGISKSSSISEYFELFDQVRGPHGRPILSLAPLKNGICSVRFNTSISLLQAFFISVVITSNHQLSSIVDFSKLAEAILQDPRLSGIDREKAMNVDPVQGLGKYVSPPYSPPGRV